MHRRLAGWLAAVAVLVPMLFGEAACQDAARAAAALAPRAGMPPAAGSLEGMVQADQYVLGPGDVLAIGMWGDANRSDQVVVNPDGDALVPPVGPLHVTGLTLAEARKLITERLSVYYRPAILSVSLVSVRSFQVHVVGMVIEPGALEANGVTRVSQAITLAGGLEPHASDRNIRLVRPGDTLRVDLTRYLLLGDNRMNPFLNDGDVVYVPPRLEDVLVRGSVYREGSYEFAPGETLADVLELAGGLRPEAVADSLEIARFRVDFPESTETILLAAEPEVLSGFQIKPGDRIFVRAIPDWHRDAKVVISGEVSHPGVYVIDDGAETLSGLIERAGGLTERASLAEARLVRGLYASRRFPVESKIDSARIAEGQLTAKEMGLVETLVREPKGAVSIDFEQLYGGKGRPVDLALYDGDAISIPTASMSVRVSGQVKRPGLVTFKAGEKASYYIKQAGGYAPDADKRGVELVTAESGQMRSPSGGGIRPGDIVWVPREREVSTWGAIKDVLQVIAQVATIYIVVDQITTK